MAVFNLLSKRRKAEVQGGAPDVYQYDSVPKKLRAQVVHLCLDAIGTTEGYGHVPEIHWQYLHDALAREKGVLALGKAYDGYGKCCVQWFLESASHEDALDFIELVAQHIDCALSRFGDQQRRIFGIKQSSIEALDELNQRFRENGLGYSYENGYLIRLDSQYIHSEVVRPALALLSEAPFARANEDFLLAHKHYRNGLHEDCVVACQRAFESTLKAICTSKKWAFKNSDRASDLITVVRNNGLLPTYLDKSLDTFVAMLKSGLPEVRNNAGGHGVAPDAAPVPSYMAAYALHLAAASIVMMVEAFKVSS
jgi:hypothetical protein